MGTALLWWTALEILSLAAVPLALLLFRSLPDRGYAFTKVLGPLLLALLVWWTGSLGVLSNQRGTVLLLTYLLVIGGTAGIALLRRRDPSPAVPWPAILLTEALFAGVFAAWALLRAYMPDIDGTEKPMDFALLNASYRAPAFPPEDPWLSGNAVHYYYLGYLNAATLTKLVGASTAVGFNLALATLAAQAAAAVAGLVYNLTESLRRARSDDRPRAWIGPLAAGLLAAALLLGIGNLEGPLELARARGWGTDALWQWVDVRDLKATPVSAQWYPTDTWFWWRATRVIHTTVGGHDVDYTITEFPFFSFLLGDLHAHVMALPLVLLLFGLAAQLFLDREPPQLRLRRPLSVLGSAALLGALGFTNVWDLPAVGGLILTTGGARWLLVRERSPGERLAGWAVWAVAVTAGAILLYLPFYAGLAGTGSAVLGGAQVAAGSKPGPVGWWMGPGSRPLHLLLLWAPFLAIASAYLWSLIAIAPRAVRTPLRALLLTPVILWLGLEATAYPVHGDTVGRLHTVASKLWPVGPLLAALVLLLGLLWRASSESGEESKAPLAEAEAQPGETPLSPPRALVFVTGLMAAALLLLLLCEVIFLRDVFNNRMNTVFKLSYQTWALLAGASAFGLYYLWAAGERPVWRRAAFAAPVTLLVVGAFLYVPAALFNRTGGFSHPPTLDGLAFVNRTAPAQRAAVDWLWAKTAGHHAVILEASGPQYSSFALMSSRTGLPTLLGWAGHESQWRGPLPAFAERQQAIDQMYQATDKAAVLPLLLQYGVSYVIVGPAERSVYSPAGLDAFANALPVAFRQGDVTIYGVPPGEESSDQ